MSKPPDQSIRERAERAQRGLCNTCVWARSVANRRGSAFLLCGRHRLDSRFPKYPPLPVSSCAGYEARSEQA